MNIDKSLKNKKTELLNYFRNRAEEFLSEIKLNYGNTQFKEQASAINKSLIETKDNLITALLQKANIENWTNKEKLECILMVTMRILKMKEYSGFDIKKWIKTNVNWEHDFKVDTIRFFNENSLTQYLIW